MKWLGTGPGLVALQTFDVLCTYQLGEELEALLPVQVKLHFSANQSGSDRLFIIPSCERKKPPTSGAFDRCLGCVCVCVCHHETCEHGKRIEE